jgi:hypothetical protein
MTDSRFQYSRLFSNCIVVALSFEIIINYSRYLRLLILKLSSSSCLVFIIYKNDHSMRSTFYLE